MKVAVLHGPEDVRFEDRPSPAILHPTDAVIRISAACVCGSDLWPYRGISPVDKPTPMGHEYCGIVEEVGPAVQLVKPGQFVVGSFFASDNTCPICQAGYQSRCVHSQYVGAGGAQAPRLRVPLADGTLVAAPDLPSDFWAEHSRFFRNADTQNAQCASVAGCRSSRNEHKTRADEPVVLDARDKSASVPENCLPLTASAGTKADTFHSLSHRFNR